VGMAGQAAGGRDVALRGSSGLASEKARRWRGSLWTVG
jgi:hypothetical protein